MIKLLDKLFGGGGGNYGAEVRALNALANNTVFLAWSWFKWLYEARIFLSSNLDI